MNFNQDKVKEANGKEEWRGEYNRIFTDRELIDALNSGLFRSKAAIARYFGVTKSAVYARIKKLKEKGILLEENK